MKPLDYLIVFASLILALLLNNFYEKWQSDQESQQKIQFFLSRYSQVLTSETEQLDRRLEDLNTALIELYELINLLDDYQTNQSKIRVIYQSHLKYYFKFNTQLQLSSSLLMEYVNQIPSEVQLHFIQLDGAISKAIDNEATVVRLTESQVWQHLFLLETNMTNFKLNNPQVNIPIFRNLVLEYIKRIEVSFLSLQTVNQNQKELQQLIQPWAPDESQNSPDILDSING